MNAVYEVAPIRPRIPSKRRVEAGRPELFDTHYLKLKRHLSMEVIARSREVLNECGFHGVRWRRHPNMFGMSLLMPRDTEGLSFSDVKLQEVERALREDVPSLRRDRRVTFDTIDIFDFDDDQPQMLALIPRQEDLERLASEQQKIRDVLAEVALGDVYFPRPVSPHVTLGKVGSSHTSKRERQRMRGILRSHIVPFRGLLHRPKYQYFDREEPEESQLLSRADVLH